MSLPKFLQQLSRYVYSSISARDGSILIVVQPPGTRRRVWLVLSPNEPSAKAPKPPLLIEPQISFSPQSESDTLHSQMCRIEQFDVVYPNGTREPREQVIPCPRGTHSQPCSHYEVVRVGDRLASPSDLRTAMLPNIILVEPRDVERPRSSRDRNRGPIEGLALELKFWNPFARKNRKKKEKPQYYLVRRTKKSGSPPAIIQDQPPPPPIIIAPVREESPVVIPVQPPADHTTHRPPGRGPRRRGRKPAPPIIHQSSEEDGDESTSPLEANRQHGRRSRSLSAISRYHVEKEAIRLRELRERERRAQEVREAQERAERAEIRARLERQREQREREEENERRRQLRQLRHEVRDLRRQRQIEEQARILQEQEDLERLRANRLHREEQARRLQEVQDRRRAAEQARHQYAEAERRARARQANVPRAPRHPAFVHHDEDHLDRGERFIRDAKRAENVRQFERRARQPRGLYDDDAPRRRNTIDGGQRWHDERRRRDRRDRR